MDTSTTAYKDWHSPANQACPHNADIGQACECKRIRVRKPFRVLRVVDCTAGHGCRKQFVIEVHPKGLLVIREQGRTRRSSIEVTVATVYERALMVKSRNAILAKRNARASARAARRSARKALLKLAA